MSNLITRIEDALQEYQEDTAKEMTTDGVNYFSVKNNSVTVGELLQWLKDNETWYSIEPTEVKIEVTETGV